MTELPELVILRHGETEWNRLGRMQGALDSPLTDTGKAQAKMQGGLIAGLGQQSFGWFSSPQGRAVQTAQIAGAGLGVKAVEDQRLREIEMGAWTGMSRDNIRETAPHLFENPQVMAWYGQAPGGESLEDLADRIRSFLTGLNGPSVIVTHGITSRMMRCVALGLAPSQFWQLGGGQGVLYRVSGASYQQISADGVIAQTLPLGLS